jgi:uncharacterized RDD family membrane protein YckC
MHARLPGETRPAGFWIRVAAGLVDLALIAIVQRSFALAGRRLWGASIEDAAAFQTSIGFFTLVFAALYTAVLHAGEGQTIGKMLTGVRVVTVDGERLPFGAGLLRWFAYFASLLPLGAGFLMAGLRHDKRALHDLLAGSRVERTSARRRARPAAPPAPRAPAPEPV